MPEALLAAFPDGANTTCQVGDIKMTAGEAGKLKTGGRCNCSESGAISPAYF
ncbi:MAG: MTH865 family protein [Candidatus Methanoperedens sp.]|nr:MTH865 family protein [Candidatus Methanoperedens sp.]